MSVDDGSTATCISCGCFNCSGYVCKTCVSEKVKQLKKEMLKVYEDRKHNISFVKRADFNCLIRPIDEFFGEVLE